MIFYHVLIRGFISSVQSQVHREHSIGPGTVAQHGLLEIMTNWALLTGFMGICLYGRESPPVLIHRDLAYTPVDQRRWNPEEQSTNLRRRDTEMCTIRSVRKSDLNAITEKRPLSSSETL